MRASGSQKSAEGDLIAAARYLEENHQAPALLIGHSLGGAAVLAAAHAVESAVALVTIGAPSTADHVSHLFAHARGEIEAQDEATVDLAGRQFTIKRQFLEDLDRHNSTDHIRSLNKALLIFHSPIDTTVPIDEAARIYGAARHPKSFISLDKVDHLLSRREDSEYVATVIAAWAGRYLPAAETREERSSGTAPTVKAGQVLVSEQDQKFTRRIYTEHHQLIADEPRSAGGADLGANPYEYLLASLGACSSMTIRMYANRKKLALAKVDVTLEHSRIHAQDCEACESETGYVDRIEKGIRLEGDLSDDERQRLLQIADRCPVHKTLHNEILIESQLA